MTRLFASGGQSIGASGSVSVLPMNIQGWFPLGLTDLISLLSKGLSSVFSRPTVQKHHFFSAQPPLQSSPHIHTWLLGPCIIPTLVTDQGDLSAHFCPQRYKQVSVAFWKYFQFLVVPPLFVPFQWLPDIQTTRLSWSFHSVTMGVKPHVCQGKCRAGKHLEQWQNVLSSLNS